MNDRTILVTGATGQQGGSLVRALAGTGFRIRALTRKPDSDAAAALRARGVDVVAGDLNDEASLVKAMAGVWGVYAVQNTWEAGVELEETQGKRLASAAHSTGVQHFVYSSVGSAHRETGIPHFDNKSRIEAHIRDLAFPSHVIIRPVFFMENLVTPWFLNGDAIHVALPPTTTLQMIAVDDIGVYAARAFVEHERLNGRAIDVAGDSRTMPDVARVLTAAFGRPIAFVQVPIEAVRKNSEDFALMLEWFARVGYDADIPALEREFGTKSTTLEVWAAKQAKR